MPKVSKVPKVGKENTNTKARREYLERTKVPKMPKVSKVSDEAVSTQRSAFSLKHPPLLSCLPFFVLSWSSFFGFTAVGGRPSVVICNE